MGRFADAGVLFQVFVVVIAVVGTGRLTRLFAEDSFPPVVALRGWWISRFNDSEWSLLALCGYCQSMYIALFTLVTGLWSGFHPVWLVFYSWLSLAYLAAILTAYDGGDR